MKNLLRTALRPILDVFESGDGEFVYKPSYRLILKIVGSLFLMLSAMTAVAGVVASQIGALFPCIIFTGAGFVCLIVGFLGTNQAVANIWKSR